jgi:hypothetical protein
VAILDATTMRSSAVERASVHDWMLIFSWMNGFLRIRKIIFAQPEKRAFLTKMRCPLSKHCFGVHERHRTTETELFAYPRLPILTFAEL